MTKGCWYHQRCQWHSTGNDFVTRGFLKRGIPTGMVGQVYVKATGKINVGDLLTTSNTPGHAMTAKNKRKSPGAVIGKAMSGQDGGEGFVLVLVNLQ